MSRILLFLLSVYRKYISPLLPRSCRFYPSCSVYAMEAITKYGALKGLLLAAWRLLRCNPFCKCGYDPLV